MDAIPTATSDVTINVPGSYIVTVSGAQAAQTLVLDANTSRLQIAGTLALAGALTQTAGTIVLASGGHLQGATLIQASGFISGSGGTLDGLTVQGPLSLGSTASLNVSGGLIFSGPGGSGRGSLTRSLGPTVSFAGDTTIDNVDVMIDGKTLAVAAGKTLTLGPAASVTLEALSPGDFGGTGLVVNLGTIVGPDINGAHSIVRFARTLVNQGVIALNKDFISIGGDLVNSGTITLNSLGNASVAGNLTGSGLVAMAGSIVVTGTIGAGVTIAPLAANAALVAGAIDPGATILAEPGIQKIDLTGLPFDAGATAVATGGRIAIVQSGNTLASVNVVGLLGGATLGLASDGRGNPGTMLTLTNTPCFLEGTRIMTARGEVAVERLLAGDLVPAARAGGLLPIVWIGRRSLTSYRHPRPDAIWPVRIAAGAIADGVPKRDLFVSPEHAIWVNGVLVPARHLINGATIVQRVRARMTYFHVELPRHDLLLSDGLLTESYLDLGNRADFENAGPVVAVHPMFGAGASARWAALACAPQVRSGPRLAAIRRGLARRAEGLGFDGAGRLTSRVGVT